MLATPQAQMAGTYRFEYAVLPYALNQGVSSSLQVYQEAFAYTAPLRATGVSLHTGRLPTRASLIAVSPQAFAITAIKTAEDGRGWVARGYNLTSQPIQVTLVPWRPYPVVERVDLREQAVEQLPAAQDGRVSFTVSGCEIATVKFSV
jgi:alpha-mannosidase